MSFAWPQLLYLLIIPLVLLLREWRQQEKRRQYSHPKILHAEAGQNHLRLSGRASDRRQHPRLWLYLGLVLSILALARPQWGRIEEPVFDQSREILIAVDLSRSMLAEDVRPSRLDRAKLLINSLLEKLQGERVGLIVFSGTAFLQSPLSADYEILREFLPALDPDYLPQSGTSYHALVETTLSAFASTGSADRFLIVLSDGEATDEDWRSSIEKLKEKGIRTIALGIGSTAGAMIPDGDGGYVKDDRGAVVLSKLSSNTLQQIAAQTQGVYRDASSWLDLASLLQETVEAGRKGEFVDKNTVRLVERFQWALIPAFICFLMSFWREFPVRPRPRDLKLDQIKSTLLLLGLLLPAWPQTGFSQNNTPTTEPPSEPDLTPLGKIVSRLSTQETRTAQDWADLAQETVTWGQKYHTAQQTAHQGPVHDALLAVDLGSQLDAEITDWDQLRRDLEALLQKPDQQQQQQPQDQQNQNQQQQEQQNQDQQSGQQNQSQNGQSDDQQNPSQSSQNSDSSDQSQKEQSQPQQSESDPSDADSSANASDQQPDQKSENQQSAFGDMSQKEEPPQASPEQMQQVGGAKQGDTAQQPQDRSLAMPLQKLDKVRQNDSPAQLFQMMEGSPDPSQQSKGKTW